MLPVTISGKLAALLIATWGSYVTTSSKSGMFASTPERRYMRRALYTALACLIIVGGAFASDDLDHFRRAAEDAKARGLAEIVLPAPAVMNTGVIRLDQVAADYTIVLAEPLSEKTVISGGWNLATWYKLKLREVLVMQLSIPDEQMLSAAPAALLPLGPGEFFMRRIAGSIVYDGVKFVQKSPDQVSFQPGTVVMLFLRLVDGGKYGQFASVSDSSFTLMPDGTLRPQGPADLPLAADIAKRLPNIALFKQELGAAKH